uniref:Uncharacterized protein n=1 Tax=Ciona savignyi TaxID=51511 RepID=H2YM32_CIOSA
MSTSVEDYQLEIKKLKETIEQNNQILHNAGKEGKELLERNSNLEEQIQQIHVDYSKTIEQLEQDKYSLKSRLDLLESSTKRLEQLVNEEKEVWKTKCERRITNLEKSHHSEILVYKQQTTELQSELDEARLVQQQQEERVNRQDEIIQQLRTKQ